MRYFRRGGARSHGLQGWGYEDQKRFLQKKEGERLEYQRAPGILLKKSGKLHSSVTVLSLLFSVFVKIRWQSPASKPCVALGYFKQILSRGSGGFVCVLVDLCSSVVSFNGNRGLAFFIKKNY
jgi:hypothetical protein